MPSPAQDLGQAVSSVNSYCTIILEYLVAKDINIISVKLRCLHPTFSSVILVRGVGSKPSMLVYLTPRSGFGSGSVIGLFLLHHNLGIFSCKRYKHYFSQTEMFTFNLTSVFLVRGVEVGVRASCPGCFLFPPPGPGLRTGNVINQFLLHHKLGTFSHKHYYSQTVMFTFKLSLVTFVRGVGGKLSRLLYLAPAQYWVRQCH